MYIKCVAIHRTRKDKVNPHYNFLYSWQPAKADVNRETVLGKPLENLKLSTSKKAAELAKKDSSVRIKKDIVKSLILVSFVLLAEVVVYLARSYIKLP